VRRGEAETFELHLSCRVMIPAYDFGPVGGGVTFLPKGKRGRGHVPGPKLHDSPDS
jgi:hypothetical protein